MFQSPCGDLLIGNLGGKDRILQKLEVSVPLRGFINRKLRMAIVANGGKSKFQSPCGDLLIGNALGMVLKKFISICFSPLAGIY